MIAPANRHLPIKSRSWLSLPPHLSPTTSLDLLLLPPPSPKDRQADHGERGKRDRDRGEDPARAQSRASREKPGERAPEEPADEEVDARRGPGAASAREGLRHEH